MTDYGPKDMKKIRKSRMRNSEFYKKARSIFYVGDHKCMAMCYDLPYWLNPPYVDPADGRVTKKWRQITYLMMN